MFKYETNNSVKKVFQNPASYFHLKRIDFDHKSLFQFSLISKGVMKLFNDFIESLVKDYFSNGFNLAMWQSVRKIEHFMEILHIIRDWVC